MQYSHPKLANAYPASVQTEPYMEQVDRVPVRARLESIAAGLNGLACGLSSSLDKVRVCPPVASGGASPSHAESIEDWLQLIEMRLKDACYAAQQIDERL